jgi:hypothetical protein
MILTDLYRFEKLPDCKSKLRIDCTASTSSYNPLEELKNKKGELFLYLGDNTYTKAGQERKADLALSRTSHISSVYTPDIEKNLWYGDFKGTADALLFVCHNATMPDGRLQAGAVIEIFIARGQRNNRVSLYNLLCDGEIDNEMELLRGEVSKSIAEPPDAK